MQSKIIIGLSVVIVGLLLAFQTYRLGIERKERKELQAKVEMLAKQNEEVKLDQAKQNEELKKAYEEKNILQAKIKNTFKVDSCVNTIIEPDFIKLLQE